LRLGHQAVPDSLLVLESLDGELPAQLRLDQIDWNEDDAGVPQGGQFSGDLLVGRR